MPGFWLDKLRILHGRAGIRILSILDISTVDITMRRVASQRALIDKHLSYVFPKYGIPR